MQQSLFAQNTQEAPSGAIQNEGDYQIVRYPDGAIYALGPEGEYIDSNRGYSKEEQKRHRKQYVAGDYEEIGRCASATAAVGAVYAAEKQQHMERARRLGWDGRSKTVQLPTAYDATTQTVTIAVLVVPGHEVKWPQLRALCNRYFSEWQAENWPRLQYKEAEYSAVCDNPYQHIYQLKGVKEGA